MYNTKGLSAIVATVLIILLVIAGVTLVWSPVRKLISSAAEESEANCLLANPEITKACMNSGALEITVSNGAEGAINSFQVIYGDSADNLNNTESVATSIGINEVKKLTVAAAKGTPASAKIAAVINGETCPAGSASIVSTSC